MNYNSLTHKFSVRFMHLFLGIWVMAVFAPGLTHYTYAADKPVKIVVLGDSLSAGFGLAPGEAFPEQLAKRLAALKYSVEIINGGVSGDTTQGGLSRLDWTIATDTRIVIVELGANDALRGIAPETTRKNLEAIITRLNARTLRIILAGMLAPPNLGEDYEKQFNAIFPDLAKKYQLAFFPFFLEGVAANPALNQADGMHPTKKGIEIITDKFLPLTTKVIDQLLKSN